MPTTFHFAFYQVAWNRRIAVPLEPRDLHIMEHDTASYLCRQIDIREKIMDEEVFRLTDGSNPKKKHGAESGGAETLEGDNPGSAAGKPGGKPGGIAPTARTTPPVQEAASSTVPMFL